MGSDETHGIEFAVLGPLEVTREGRIAHLGGSKPRAVLAMLLLNPGRVVGIETLVDALWGDGAPATAVKSIHKYVSQLRKELGGVIGTYRRGYTLVVAPDRIDARRFEHLLDQAREPIPAGEVVDLLNRALSLWRGEAFSDCPENDVVVAERARLEERRLTAMEELVRAELELGRHSRVVSRLEQLVAENPLREGLWRQLLLALYRSGRQADALHAYQRLRRTLVDELAIEPSPELQDLQKRILAQDAGLGLPEFQPSARESRGPPPTNIPAQLTSFVGRTSELHEIADLLCEARLVTLVGAGGSGKTRLALEVARGAENYRDGVWLVDLAPLTSPDQVAGAFAAPLRLGEQPGRAMDAVLAEFLANKDVLIIVDNCEHLVDAVADLVAGLLRESKGLRVLATSREALSVAGEVGYDVAPLAVPEPGDDVERIGRCDSVRLFVERARSVDTRFELTTGNADAVAHICSRLDGIPLALELAAGLLRAFGPDQLLTLIDDHFDVLAVAPRTAPARHRTLSAAIGWSHDLLSDAERRFFRRLSVFRGGFDLEAAEQVCSDEALPKTDVLVLLPHLVAKSLVGAVRRLDGEARYRLLETLRDYGRRRLEDAGESEAVLRRHAVYFCSLAEEGDRGIRGPGQEAWIERLSAESGNLRAALAWSFESGEVETGLRLAAHLFSYVATFWFWDMRGANPAEGLEWLQKGLSRSDGVSGAVRTKALAAAGFLAESQGDHERASTMGQQSRALYRELGDESGVAMSTLLLGATAHYQGDYERATKLLEASLETFTKLGETWNSAWTMHRLGMVARHVGDYQRAIDLHERSLALYKQVGDRSRAGYSHWMLGVVARYQGDYRRSEASCEQSLRLFEERGDRAGIAHVRATVGDVARLEGDSDRAVTLYEECCAQFQELGDRRCVASSLANLGAVASNRSQHQRARSLYEDSLAIRTEIGDLAGVAECLDGLARVGHARGLRSRAATLMGAADAWRDASGAVLAEADRPAYETEIAALQAALGETAFRKAWREGRSMVLDEAVALALGGRPDPVARSS